VRGRRQHQRNDRSSANQRLYKNPTAMLVHDRFDGCQAQSAAAWFGREANLKDSVSDAFRDPGAHVFNLDSHVLPNRKIRRGGALLIDILGTNLEPTFLRMASQALITRFSITCVS
jgi:hypothetical protein